MHRRIFLKNSLLAGLAVTPVVLVSCDRGSAPVSNPEEKTVSELREMLKAGTITCVSLTKYYLNRIEQFDKTGPALHSVIEINPDALAIAEERDRELKEGRSKGPLHGIPVLIKDNIDSHDNMQTTAGSLALEGNRAPKDAFIVLKLRESGAILLGKTNLSEWANFRSTRSVSGWSSRGGQTKNPYLLDRSPCGSSSGSAVAVSANLCAVAVGTETDGSIACPASMNGIAGIKPTVGLVSRSGIIPISKSQDTAGPLARTVTDAALLLNILAGRDEADVAMKTSSLDVPDYTRFLNTNGLKGKRIGVEKSFLKRHEKMDSLLANALEQLRQGGAEIIEVEFMAKAGELGKEEFEMMEYEFKDGLNKYLSTSGSRMKSLSDIIRFNVENRDRVMPWFGQEIMESSDKKGSLESPEYLALRKKMDGMKEFLTQLLDCNRLDALCGPATGTAWCNDPVNGDFWTGYGAYTPAAIAGWPSVTVPMGFVAGLPVGLSFLGRAFSEPLLISIAYAYEQISKNRQPPAYLPTLKI